MQLRKQRKDFPSSGRYYHARTCAERLAPTVKDKRIPKFEPRSYWAQLEYARKHAA
jgi:hypothetical protein